MNEIKISVLIAAVLCAGLTSTAHAALRHDAPVATLDQDDDAGAEGDERAPELSAAERAHLAGFKVAGAATSSALPALDPDHVVPASLLADAVAYFQANQAKITNQDWLTVVDFSRSSTQARMFLVDLHTGKVQAIHVAHGSGSDPRGTGKATIFSNADGSNCSSLGFYLTAETYDGKHGYSCRLDGLSATNSNVRSRAVVIHGADYVHDSDVKQGRSWGCLALSMSIRTNVIDRLKGGSLIYAGQSNP